MADANLIIAVCFVGVFSLIVGAYWAFVVVPERRGQGVVRRRLRWQALDPRAAADVRLLKKEQVLSSIASLDVLLKRTDNLSRPLKELVDQADVGLTVGSFLLITIGS